MTRTLPAVILALAVTLLPAASSALPRAPFASAHAGGRSIEKAPLHDSHVDVDSEDDGTVSGVDGRLGEVWRVPMRAKEIALTFDDGPYPFYTSLLLHELERSHVVGTFFLVGRSSQEFPELVRDIVADGDEIGNHTFNHYKLTKLSLYQVQQQISSDGAFLAPFIGHPLHLFRPPHGRFDHRVIALAHSMGYETVFWNDSPEDTKDVAPSLIVSRVLAQATPGGIVLLHNGQYKTVEALPVIIDRLRARGYRFVTVSQLLDDGEVDPARNTSATPFIQ